MEKIKTFEDACKKLKIKPTLPDLLMIPEDLRGWVISAYRLAIITRALNGKWEPNWDDYNEYKYFPWFYLNKPGFRFLDTYYDFTTTITASGSQLCFKSEELSKYAGNTFLSEYEKFFTIKEVGKIKK
jgi:hypothetical protein